jgi:LuxR family maltose regulon positive regulatory protein
MARPVIATKVYLPKVRPELVARPRLRELRRRAAQARLTLVSAPAGFGKTTLLADWLNEAAREGDSVAWLSLGPADGDPASFWTCVLTAIQAALPEVGSGALALIAASPVPAPLPTELVLTTLVNELAAASGEIWLVLDDYHLVDGNEVSAGVTFFLEHLPPHVHVVFSTRADPDLPLSRWRVRAELAEIRAADLCFTADEAAAYLNGVAGLTLAPQHIAALEERTEGWIAALQLAALSLQGREDVGGFIARFAGDDRYIVDYLVDEVLARQTEELREFLVQSAVLDRLTGPLCDAVTGRRDGSATLVALERANLFIVPLDDRREWYRYHHLFSDVLRARLLAEQPDLVALLHRRAGQWFEGQWLEGHDLLEEAVGHALAGRDFDRAGRLMERAVPAIRRDRREAMLIGWLRVLPEDVARRSPALSIFRVYLCMVAGDLDGVEAGLDDADHTLAAVSEESAASGAAHRADTEELHTLASTVALYRASLAQARGDVAGTERHARRALELADPSDHLGRGGAVGFIGLAAWARGDVTSALTTFAQAVASLHAAGNLVDELSSTVILADMWLAAGRPSTAVRLYRSALRVAEEHGDTVARATADLHVGISEIDREAGDLNGATRHLDRAAALGEPASMGESRYRWFVARSRLAESEGDPARAITLLTEAERLYRPAFYPDVRPIAAMKARVWIVQGELAQAEHWARQRGVSVVDDADYLSEFDHLTLVRLLLAQHRAQPRPGVLGGAGSTLDDAAGLLHRLEALAETSGRDGSLLEIRLLAALALQAQGRRAQALARLSHAWAQAPEPEGHLRLYLDEGAAMVALLQDAERQGDPSGQARRLLSLAGLGGGGGGVMPVQDGEVLGARGRPAMSLAAASAPSLSDRELQVLRLLDSELTGPQIARELFVSHNTLRTHTKHIFAKLDVTSRRAAVIRARDRGLL